MSGARFRPAPLLAGFHRQTLAGALLRRERLRSDPAQDELWLPVEPGTRVRLRWTWARAGAAPALLLVHGMCGSSRSAYMLGTLRRALRRGVHVARLDLRGARGCEAHASWLGHAGLWRDLAAAVESACAEARVEALTVAGFSMGGNLALKLAAHWGDAPPPRVRAVGVVSAAVRLADCQRALDGERGLAPYRDGFLIQLRRFVREHARLHGERPWTAAALAARSLREYDAAAVCPVYGFEDPDDYYARASAESRLPALRVPTLALHAADDRIVPCGPLLVAAAASNPALRVELEQNGGHCAFVGHDARRRFATRFWAEARLAELAASGRLVG